VKSILGKHGKSLKLDEKGINSNARERAVVIHGAIMSLIHLSKK
jgi:hypothetical protein